MYSWKLSAFLVIENIIAPFKGQLTTSFSFDQLKQNGLSCFLVGNNSLHLVLWKLMENCWLLNMYAPPVLRWTLCSFWKINGATPCWKAKWGLPSKFHFLDSLGVALVFCVSLGLICCFLYFQCCTYCILLAKLATL